VTQSILVIHRLVVLQILCCKGHNQATEIYRATLKLGYSDGHGIASTVLLLLLLLLLFANKS
jgi:hypothetical protein